MVRIASLMLLAALVCEGRPVFASVLHFSVSESENLHYQLDCLAGVVRCSKDSMALEVFEHELPLLDRWRDLRQTTDVFAGSESVTRGLLPLMANTRDLSSRHIADPPSRRAHDALAKVTGDDIATHFRARFSKRWESTDATHLTRIKSGLAALLADAIMNTTLENIAGLFHVSDPAPVDAVLLATDSTSNGSIATLDMERLYIETPRNENASSRLPVVLHELVHRWQQLMPPAQQDEIQRAFADAENDCALAASHIFEEVVATAIGNGMIEQILLPERAFEHYRQMPMSFYADHDIDVGAKALLPLVREFVEAGRALDAGFVAQYIEVIGTALPGRCRSLAAELRNMNLLIAGNVNMRFQSAIHQQWRPNTLVTMPAAGPHAGHAPFSRLPTLVLTTYPLLDSLPPAFVPPAALANHTDDTTAIYGDHASTDAAVYWVVGKDWTAVEKGLEKLLSSSPDRFSGFFLPDATG